MIKLGLGNLSGVEKMLLLILLAVLSLAFLGAILFVARQVIVYNSQIVAPVSAGSDTNSEMTVEEQLAYIDTHLELAKGYYYLYSTTNASGEYSESLRDEYFRKFSMQDSMVLRQARKLGCDKIPASVILYDIRYHLSPTLDCP